MRRRARRGVVLLDAIIAGLVLGIGLTVVVSLTARSLAEQANGERQLVASWLLDEMLSMVLVEGPVNYQRLYDNSGRFDPPFDDFTYELEIEDIGLREPLRVTATVRWPGGRGFREASAQTYIAQRLGEPEQRRRPLDPIDRESRYYDEQEEDELP